MKLLAKATDCKHCGQSVREMQYEVSGIEIYWGNARMHGSPDELSIRFTFHIETFPVGQVLKVSRTDIGRCGEDDDEPNWESAEYLWLMAPLHESRMWEKTLKAVWNSAKNFVVPRVAAESAVSA